MIQNLTNIKDIDTKVKDNQLEGLLIIIIREIRITQNQFTITMTIDNSVVVAMVEVETEAHKTTHTFPTKIGNSKEVDLMMTSQDRIKVVISTIEDKIIIKETEESSKTKFLSSIKKKSSSLEKEFVQTMDQLKSLAVMYKMRDNIELLHTKGKTLFLLIFNSE